MEVPWGVGRSGDGDGDHGRGRHLRSLRRGFLSTGETDEWDRGASEEMLSCCFVAVIVVVVAIIVAPRRLGL